MNKVVDLKGVSCGLVPTIVDHLKSTEAPIVDVQIRCGIREEILNGFGTGGDWDIEFITELGFDVVRFTRHEKTDHERLNILEY